MWICCPHTKWFYVGMLNVLFSPQAAKRGDTRSTWTEEGRLYTLRCRKEGIKPEYQPAIQYVPQDNRDRILLPDTPILHGLRRKWVWEKRKRPHIPTLSFAMHPSICEISSKRKSVDDAVIIGGSHKNCSWLSKLIPALKSMKRSGPLLFDISPRELTQIIAAACRKLGWHTVNRHRLRVRSASADASGYMEEVEIQRRGRSNDRH